MQRQARVFLIAFALAACGEAAEHPGLRDAGLPPLIPLHELFANPERALDFQLAPDGEHIAWLGIDGFSRKLFLSDTDGANERVVESDFPVRGYSWDATGERVLVEAGGQLWIADPRVAEPELTPLLPAGLTPAHLVSTGAPGSETIFLTSPGEDGVGRDLYHFDPVNGAHEKLAADPGDVAIWILGAEGGVAGRLRYLDAGERALEVPDGGGWRETARLAYDESLAPVGFVGADGRVHAVSNRGRDRAAVVELDLASGAERVLYEHPVVDVAGLVLDPGSGEPRLAWSYPGYIEYHHFDAGSAAEFARLAPIEPAEISLLSASRDGRWATYSIGTEVRGVKFLLLDREADAIRQLAPPPFDDLAESFSTTRPIAYEARDGTLIHGLLTLPRGAEDKRVPLVLQVHGGPWIQDVWRFDRDVQFLANRGYAVLRVNFRGSAGYGRDFTALAGGEFGGAMQQDLIDGVSWAVSQGYADPDKVAIFGTSYGGYAAMLALGLTPDIFAAGIAHMGISDLQAFVARVPESWRHWAELWRRHAGDPANADDRAALQARSPIAYAERVRAPVLLFHGAADNAVRPEQSRAFAEAVTQVGGEARYIEFDDERHGIARWQNRVRYHRAIELFLAEHLGGRAGGYDRALLAAWLL